MTLSPLRINQERLRQDFESLAQIGATSNGGVSRLALAMDDLEARAWFANAVEDAGLLVRDDEVANLSGVLMSKTPHAKTLLIGSHLDTVVNGGQYDGAVGVLCALECLRTIKEAGLALPVHLEAMNFTDEEGTWVSLLGSRGIVGKLPIKQLQLKSTGAFHAALARAGIELEGFIRAKRDPHTLLAYLELHIEQGARLEREQIPIGIVQNIVGRSNFIVTYRGKSGHSGTTEYQERRDALQGAAQFVIGAHQQIRQRYENAIVNCGQLEVVNGAYNLIPSHVVMGFECRHTDPSILQQLESELLQWAESCAEAHRLTVSVQQNERMEAAVMDERIQRIVMDICDQSNLGYLPLVSYAGHDAQMLSQITPSAMIFIPCQGGISHNPQEFTAWEDVVTGANVLLQTVLRIAQYGLDGS
ncbi:MAG: Zn-dependent hydrolase [Phototrophicaceae bacterium]